MYKELTDLQSILKPEQKYTIFTMGGCGFPMCIQAKFIELSIRPWAQYNKSYLIAFKQKGKRKENTLRINRSEEILIIWEGWREIKADMFGEEETSKTGVIYKTSLLSFSHKYVDMALASCVQKPLFFQDFYTLPEEREQNEKEMCQ